MTKPELKIDDDVIVPGGGLAVLMVVYPDRGQALVRFLTGERELYPMAELKLAPPDAIDLRQR